MSKPRNTEWIAVLGAYGTFGQRITRSLLKQGYRVLAIGRQENKLRDLVNHSDTQTDQLCTRALNVNGQNLVDLLIEKPVRVVIHTCGPFQEQDYSIAKACIRAGCHYIDLADDSDFVSNITQLDPEARQKQVAIISGASTVPALSSAVIEAKTQGWQQITSIRYGISPGQKTPRGLATTRSVLSYLGKPLANQANRYGWQGLYLQRYPTLKSRLMGWCSIPDNALFPSHYGIQSIQFSAGMESYCLHLAMYLLSWLVRLKLIKNPENHAKLLLRCSHFFDRWGSADGGMHVILKGIDQQSKPVQKQWYLEAKDGSGPEIPAAPSVILAKRLLHGDTFLLGAKPAIGLIQLEDYLHELGSFPIQPYSV